MRFYRLNLKHEYGTSAGFEFFTNRHDAEKAFRNWMDGKEERVCSRKGTDIEEVMVTPTKRGILSLVRLYAQHPDNG